MSNTAAKSGLRSRSPVEKAKDLQERARQKRIKLEGAAEAETLAPTQKTKASRRGVPSPKLVEEAERAFLMQEQLGLFTALPLRPSNEFPSLLARLPIFPAIARSRQQPLLDKDNALPFKTPFGRGRRHGPPVCIEDEDYLIALTRLRQKAVRGHGTKLPIPITSNPGFADNEGNVQVHVVHCTIVQILEEMGLDTNAGPGYQRVVEALYRLRNVSIELETRKQEKYLGKVTRSTSFKLVDIDMATFESNGVVFAQFHPIVAKWLQHDATFLDWSVRRQLRGRNARALHRFLSSQPKDYENDLATIAEITGWEGEKRKLRSQVEAALKQMQALNWVDSWEFTGTGRRIPYRLIVHRS